MSMLALADKRTASPRAPQTSRRTTVRRRTLSRRFGGRFAGGRGPVPPCVAVSTPGQSEGLKALQRAIERDLRMLQYPARNWVPPRTTGEGSPVLDVLIVGGGQGGLATAAALQRERVPNVLVVDEGPLDRAGPWLNFARMITLRTPKHVTGPDLGLPNLTIEAWYEAQHGAGSWDALGLIPKETWAAYLAWYRQTLKLPVRAETKATGMSWRPDDACFAVQLRTPEGEQTVYARRVVLATGIQGSGDWWVPPMIRDALPEGTWAHTRHDIDFEALRGKRVAVLGAGASAFDNASVAVEHGAEVDLYFRRDRLVDVNPYRWAEFVGFLRHHADLPDAERWAFVRQILRMGQLPPTDTFKRATASERFTLHPGSPWTSVRHEDGDVVITTPGGEHTADFVIVGTGFRTDLSRRPELAEVHEHVATWADRFTPPAGEGNDDLSRHPYLGPAFQFVERRPGEAPWVGNIYNYTFGCLLSLGFGGASISGMKYSIPRLVGGITGSLFAEDAAVHMQALRAFDLKEF
jgi:cation diffusion facilitator CzcD-associated flavoprotein CzcO